MSKLLKILLAAVAVLALLAGVIAIQPTDFRIERSLGIDASKEAVFKEINDLHRWQAWSPWAHLDPQMKTSFAGPEAGEGSSMAWAGNSDAGEGTMTIVESRAPELVRLRLEFRKPIEAVNEAKFIIETYGGKTLVTWSMTGKYGFLGKAFSLVMNMDKVVGKDFENGLGQIKLVTEKRR